MGSDAGRSATGTESNGRKLQMSRVRLLHIVGLLTMAASGCERQAEGVAEKRARPVIVKVLTKTQPPDSSLVSASVGSWKTEQVGFEVGGRVEFVAEPKTEIQGRVRDKDGKPIMEGTPVARLESERFSLQVAKAKADVKRAEQNLVVANTELKESIPAQIAAAEASRTLAKTEYDRSQRLLKQQAGSLADVDRDKANFQNAVSQIKQLEAAAKAKQAEIESLNSALLQARQSLRDAERNLEDCTLYSSFSGQIADIAVVPGSVIAAGQAVATLQMMDPIKVELEVSAEVSRQLQQREMLPVTVTLPDGRVETREGFLYLIDPLADPQTRTFTLTLLVLNEKLRNRESQQAVATTADIWRLDFKFLPGAREGMLFAEEDALLQDEEGYYLWQVTNATTHTRSPGDHKFSVRKLRITPGTLKIPYLGNWVFQQIQVDDNEFDPAVNLVVGKLNVSEGTPEEWNGDTVLLDSGGQWMLRPGDLVKVDLSGGDGVDGYFVPMDAIVRKDDRSYIFVIEGSEDEAQAKQIPVALKETTGRSPVSSLRRIEPLEGIRLDGRYYVTEGAHYLIDGEPVKAVMKTGGAK